jgi:hypothetical protein
VATTAAVEWKIAIEGTDAFGEVRRHEIRIDKSWDRLFDGEIGLSVDDGKKIMAALQIAVVNQEADAYTLFRRICPDCGVLRPVKDYTTRRIRTVFGTVEVRNPRWMLCRNCHPAFVFPFAPLQEICPDRATAELTELTARLAAGCPTARPRRLWPNFSQLRRRRRMRPSADAPFERARNLSDRWSRKREERPCRRGIAINSNWNFPAIAVGNSLLASTPPTFVARNRNQDVISNWSWPVAVVEGAARPAAAISSPPAPIYMRDAT